MIKDKNDYEKQWNVMERLGLGLSFFYFIMNSPPLSRNVTSSVTLLWRKIFEEAMLDEHPHDETL